MDSPKNESQIKKEREISMISNEKKVDQHMFLQIESLIQQQYQVFVPALVFEYRPTLTTIREFSGWDYEDLSEFFSHFGDIDLLEIYGKVAVVLFKTFIDAYTSREFLQNSSNFKDSEKENFLIRWYCQEDEHYISELMKSKLRRHSPSQIIENINTSMVANNQIGLNNNFSNFDSYSQNYNNYYNGNANEYLSTNFNGQYNYYSSMALNPKAREEFNNVLMSNSYSSYGGNSSYCGYEEDGKSYAISASDKCLVNGKYTCKFEIQIENDNEFQVARRLIGAKVFLKIILGLQYEKNCRTM
jgi:hypothetical protein